MAKLDDVVRYLGPRINALAKQGLKLGDMLVVLGKDTHEAIKDDPILLEESRGLPNTILGIDYIVDIDTPRLHAVRAKNPRRKAPA